jgi:hypothetical protein
MAGPGSIQPTTPQPEGAETSKSAPTGFRERTEAAPNDAGKTPEERFGPNPADISKLPPTAQQIANMTPQQLAQAFAQMSQTQQSQTLANMTPQQLVDFLKSLSPEQRAQLAPLLTPEQKAALQQPETKAAKPEVPPQSQGEKAAGPKKPEAPITWEQKQEAKPETPTAAPVTPQPFTVNIGATQQAAPTPPPPATTALLNAIQVGQISQISVATLGEVTTTVVKVLSPPVDIQVQQTRDGLTATISPRAAEAAGTVQALQSLTAQSLQDKMGPNYAVQSATRNADGSVRIVVNMKKGGEA